MSDTPTGSPSVVRKVRTTQGLWPPRGSSVQDLPKTGFSPGWIREGQGKRFTWPPPKAGDSREGGRSTSMMPQGNVANCWNPASSQEDSGPSPFPPQSSLPAHHAKHIAWPPPPAQHRSYNIFTKPNRQLRSFDELVTQHASIAVPPTYHAPPGTQHVEFEYSEDEES
ncbi:uncharacterized protein LOC106459324 [Limulus polyphemus]|uniref:Uncharacterized protein LOC106459324 n=1 Tax=Limulus polyphemus TaxID=6850 RepID=A0ABM1B431_LIMPO|nr:uncharacterized protein LOC106459324 [Limulus polyphemus]